MRQVHRNSVTAFKELDVSPRQEAILDVMEATGRPMTDRDIKNALGLADLNGARPRLTELVQKGILEECGDTKCFITGKTVRLLRIRQSQLEMF